MGQEDGRGRQSRRRQVGDGRRQVDSGRLEQRRSELACRVATRPISKVSFPIFSFRAGGNRKLTVDDDNGPHSLCQPSHRRSSHPRTPEVLFHQPISGDVPLAQTRELLVLGDRVEGLESAGVDEGGVESGQVGCSAGRDQASEKELSFWSAGLDEGGRR